PAPPVTYTLSLHDALPIWRAHHVGMQRDAHDAAVLAALAIDRVEMIDDHLGEFRGLERLAVDQGVVDVHRIRHVDQGAMLGGKRDRKSTRLNSSHSQISYA